MDTNTKTGEVELPIDGDATAQMDNNNNNSLNVDPQLVFSEAYMKGYTILLITILPISKDGYVIIIIIQLILYHQS
jgi:hypothetical protein